MKYASIKKYDIANGEGVRVSLFVSGCPHHCKNCFNKETWDENYGNEFTDIEEDDIIKSLQDDYIAGLSLLGGEPMWPKNQERLLPFVRKVKELYPNKDIWCYTGYLFDKEIRDKMYKNNSVTRDILKYIDVIVDGRFVDELKNISLFFRGSSNQRIIDVKKSLETNKVCEIKMKDEGVEVNE